MIERWVSGVQVNMVERWVSGMSQKGWEPMLWCLADGQHAYFFFFFVHAFHKERWQEFMSKHKIEIHLRIIYCVDI